MRPLPETFTKDQFTFRLLQRQGRVALFAKRKPNHSRDTYEVVIIQVHPAGTFKGKALPEREAMPASEGWGAQGWSCSTLKDAETKFKQLCDPPSNLPVLGDTLLI